MLVVLNQVSADVTEQNFLSSAVPSFKSLLEKSHVRGFIKTHSETFKVSGPTLPEEYFRKSVLQHLETAVLQL